MRQTAMLASALLLLLPSPAGTHPHMMAEARLDVTLSPDKKDIAQFRHIWRFDEVSSSLMLVDLDLNGDMTLDDNELGEGSKTMLESLSAYNYFQLITVDGKDVPMNPPKEIVSTWENNELFVMLETQPSAPMPLSGKIDIGVYDPTFYVAIDFTEDDKLVVADLPTNCARQVIRPDPDEAIAQNQATLDEAFRNDAANNDMSRIFATRLELTCKPAGSTQ